MIHASWSSGEWANKPLEEAVRRTQEAGILMVVSAGNQGANMDRFPYYPQVG